MLLRDFTVAYMRQCARAFSQSSRQLSAKGAPKDSFWSGHNFDSFGPGLISNAQHAAKTTQFWKKVLFFGGVPLLVLTTVNAYKGHMKEHSEPRVEFKNYAHLYIRHKPFPWGDGNHSLFHNPAYNALPETGYEAPDPALEHGHH